MKHYTGNDQQKYELLDKKTRARLPRITEGKKLGAKDIAQACFFLDEPNHSTFWYPCQFDGEDLFYGLVVDRYVRTDLMGNTHVEHDIQVDYFNLSELTNLRNYRGEGVMADEEFEPSSLDNVAWEHGDA